MKSVIVLGSGNSGAGAIKDYLMSRDDFQSPLGDQEFRIITDPDGINDLYINFIKISLLIMRLMQCTISFYL